MGAEGRPGDTSLHKNPKGVWSDSRFVSTWRFGESDRLRMGADTGELLGVMESPPSPLLLPAGIGTSELVTRILTGPECCLRHCFQASEM